MKTTKAMAAVIQKIATQHGLDLDHVGSHLSLSNDPYTRLSIECIGKNLVSVCHYPDIEVGEDPIRDPEIVYYTGYGPEWVPVEVTMATGYYSQAGWVEDGELQKVDLRQVSDLVQFSNMWARNLKAQGWLKIKPAVAV